MGKDRDESGKFTEVVPDDDLIAFLQETEGVSTVEVADHFGYERPTAYRRLRNLEDEGQVESREIGNSLLWLASQPD
jgi:predicted ArsR family transcriptional regulator